MTRVYVDRRTVHDNIGSADPEPCLVILDAIGERRAHDVRFLGPVELVSRFDAPLSNGIRVWLETEAPIEILR